jgi:hypothetical protein
MKSGPHLSSRAHLSSVGHELAEHCICDPPLERSQRFLRRLPLGQLAQVVARPALSLRIWVIATRYSAWFSRRFRLRLTQWTGEPALPLSSGAVPL